MKKFGLWAAALGIAGIGGMAGGTACTTTSSSGDDAGIVHLDGSTPTDSSTDGGGTEAAPGDDGSTADAGCRAGFDPGDPACEACIESMCCPQIEACLLDDAGVDDAGQSLGCGGDVSCVLDCLSSDGGTLADCENLCMGSHSPAEQASAHAAASCIDTNCKTNGCPQY
jgi:hypothetical protein